MCLHKEGSRLIQDKIESCSDEEFDILFDSIKCNLNEISKDQSGNYCIQKIMEVKGCN